MTGFGYNVSGFGSFPNRDNSLKVQLALIAGGGAGGHRYGGGGGAGGFFASPERGFLPSIGYAITIGAGGTAAANQAVDGADSTIVANEGAGSATIYQSKGGGGGGGSTSDVNPNNGGSGGGGYIRTNGAGAGTKGSADNSSYNSTGTDGVQGVASNLSTNDGYMLAGGGGGSSASAIEGVNTQSDPQGRTGSVGGAGTAWLDGTTYAGGGGGSIEQRYSTQAVTGVGGSGGGGQGGVAKNYFGDTNLVNATSGSTNTGSGGGGANYMAPITGARGNGGSGVVIIRYAGGTAASGGTITATGGFTYHTFTSSGTFTPS